MKWFAGALLIPAAVLCFLLAAYRDTYSLEVRRYVVTDPELGRTLGGIKIALLADLHVGRAGFLEEEILRSIEREKPDLILLAGDYIRYQGPYEPVLDVFRAMKAPLGTYAVLGNMDYSNQKGSCRLCHEPGQKDLLKGPHPVFLRNAVRRMAWKGRSFYIAGMDDPVSKRRAGVPNRDLQEMLSGIDPSVPVILLVHSPEVFEGAASRGVSLVLCGHNHGGQIAFSPGMSRFYPLEPSLDYSGGFFRKGKSILYVSRGIGTSLLPFRLGIRPEITYMEFEAGVDRQGSGGFYRDLSRTSETIHAPFRPELFGAVLDFGHHFGWNRKKDEKRSGPVLFSFEEQSELEGLGSECRVWRERQRRHATDGQYSLRIEFSPGESRRLEFTKFSPDWSGAKRLRLDLFNPQPEEMTVWLRIDDSGSGRRAALHCDRPLTLRPGMNRLSLKVDSLRGNVTGERLDLKTIERIIVYSHPSAQKKTFYLDSVRLDDAEGEDGQMSGREQKQ